jgi:hypothetical protein
MAETITIRTSSATDVIQVIEAGPQGPAGSNGANGQGVPVGGTTGQVLRKASGTNYDTEWAAAASGSGSVTSVALAGTGLSISGSPITTSGTITANVVYGTTAGTAAEGNDSRFVVASTTTPAALGTAAVGTGTTFARADHVHAIPTAANVGAEKAITEIELDPNGTNTITTAQLPARGIAFTDGNANLTVILPTPDIRKSGLTFSLKRELEGFGGDCFVTVVHNSVNLLTSYELDEAEGSIDFLWDGYEWTYGSLFFLRSKGSRRLTLPASTGTIALTSDIPTTFAASAITSGVLNNARVNFAAPAAIGNTTPAAANFTSLRVDPKTGSVGSLVVGSTTGSETNEIVLGSGGIQIKAAGGPSVATIAPPTTLSADRSYQLPNASGTLVISSTTGITGADLVTNIVSLTQAEYNDIVSPNAATLFLITDP